MTFPNFVPHAVRAFITARLDGDASEPLGYRTALANVEAKISHLLQAREPVPNDLYAHRAALAAEIEVLERLARDARMQEVYKNLALEFAAEEAGPKSTAFVVAAWVAGQNFARIRDAATSADEWRRQVIKAARTLKKLLENPPPAEQNWPAALFHLGDLIESTDHQEGRRDFHAWQNRRPALLAHPAWGIAPQPSDLVRALEMKAKTHSSTPATEVARAALNSRQRSPKMEYLRAFVVALLERGFDVQRPRIVAAMVTAAAVALNDVKADVSAVNIRSAVKKTGPGK